MKMPSLTNFTVFVIFFGLALAEAIKERDWIEAGFFAALGIISLRADFKRMRK
jgi:hypothetical protein